MEVGEQSFLVLEPMKKNRGILNLAGLSQKWCVTL